MFASLPVELLFHMAHYFARAKDLFHLASLCKATRHMQQTENEFYDLACKLVGTKSSTTDKKLHYQFYISNFYFEQLPQTMDLSKWQQGASKQNAINVIFLGERKCGKSTLLRALTGSVTSVTKQSR